MNAQIKVDNAIIMAAGMSSRFAPLSYEKPKGLTVVQGEVLIERQIRQLQEVGITDITLVLGYMHEKFMYLKDAFNVDIIINEDYYRYNNTSTLMLVLERLKNTYICSSDNFFVENPFAAVEPFAYYPVQHHTEHEAGEYYAEYDESGVITNVTIGTGPSHECMIGHVFFDHEFSTIFKGILSDAYLKPETRTMLWEKLYIQHLDVLKLHVKHDEKSIIKEFDSLEDLMHYDPSFVDTIESQIFDNITTYFNTSIDALSSIKPVTDGLTNLSFRFDYKGDTYIYRHPGNGTEKYIMREAEALAQQIALDEGLDESFIHMDPKTGWKLSHFLKNASVLDYHDESHVQQSLEMIKRLHERQIQSDFEFGIWKKSNDFIELLADDDTASFPDFDALYESVKEVYQLTERDQFPKHLCHCDFYNPNILIQDDRVFLIDWEYAGVDDAGVDLGTFIACSPYTMEEANKILDIYEGEPMSFERRRHFIGYVALASYYWFVWAIFQESNGSPVGDYLKMWHDYARLYADEALSMYGK